MSVTVMVQAEIKPQFLAQTEAAAEKMFAQLAQAGPTTVRYAAGKLPDGVTFVALLQLDDPAANPLTELPAYAEFQEGLEKWRAEPAVVQPLTMVGSYRLFD